jgi:phage terminase large subunit GpA-like protein
MQNGRQFYGDKIPWCKGVCDAWDSPLTKTVSLQWGTRLGKTTIGMQLLAKVAATRPMPGLFASSTQKLAQRTVRNKIQRILEAIPQTNEQLPPPKFRTVEEIRLRDSIWAVAWSGSDTQLADLSAFYGYANEIDKWSMNEKLGGEAGEGDPLEQFEERFKEFPNAKVLFECSPTTKSTSRIEKKLNASNNCRYWVPCPECGTYQVLKFGADSPTQGGILFDRLADGTIDPSLARRSARYVCSHPHCHYEIHDDQRPRMMRAGVWAPEGCGVDKSGQLTGTPLKDGRHWGGQLSSLYSLQMRWGDIAERFSYAKLGNSYRMFVNGWLAETYEPYQPKSEPEEVGERLKTDVPRGVMPRWATWLFAGVDVQADHYVFMVIAVGPGEREHLVEYGTYTTLDDIRRNVIEKKFPHEDGGEPLWPAFTLIDCGYLPKETYKFCKSFNGTPHAGKVQPCKGANSDCGGEAFVAIPITLKRKAGDRTGKANRRSATGLVRVRVNAFYYEPNIQEQNDEKKPGDEGSFSLCAGAEADIDLLRQMCNGAEAMEPSKSDPDKHLWVKRWPAEANDLRDTRKYARCAMDYRFSERRMSGWGPLAKRQPMPTGKRPIPVPEPETDRRDRPRFRPELGRRRGR